MSESSALAARMDRERPAAELDPAADPGPVTHPPIVLWVVGVGLAALLGAAVFGGGGSGDAAILPIGAGALALALGLTAAAALGFIPWPRIGVAGALSLALLASFAVWNAVTIFWSISPDRSWASFNRCLVYVAFLACGAFVGGLARRTVSHAAAGLGLLVAAALAWALAGKVFPALVEDGGRIARLREPVGYWNALALLFAVGLPLALWLSSDRSRAHWIRALAVVFAYGLAVGALLTYSRGGILAVGVAIAAWLVLSRTRLEGVVALAVALPAAAALFALALGRPGLVDDGQDLSVRVADGRAFGLAFIVGAGLVFAIAFLLLRLEARRPVSDGARSRLGRAAVVLLCLVAVALVAALILNRGWVNRQIDEFANPPTELVTQEASRLTSLNSNNRWSWWNEAWDAFEVAPVAGNGAGSFATVHRILRADALTVTEPHNIVLQFLADTGIIGALLAVGAAFAGLVGLAASLRRLVGTERAAAVALVAGILAYAAHSLVDFDWDFVAVTAPMLVAVGVLLAAGRSRGGSRRELVIPVVASVALVAAIVSLGAPWLSKQRVDAAYTELGRGNVEAAIGDAERARSLDPLSLDPLFALAGARAVGGDLVGARAALITAVELQPLDSDAWYQLGTLEQKAGRTEAASRYFLRAAQLDPNAPGNPGG